MGSYFDCVTYFRGPGKPKHFKLELSLVMEAARREGESHTIFPLPQP